MDRMGEATAEITMDSSLVHCRVRDTGGTKEVPVADVIARHVKQVADFNKALEKRRLWKEREKEIKAKHRDTWGILRSSGVSEGRTGSSHAVSSSAKRVLDSLRAEGVDREVVERVKNKIAREFGSLDAHAAIRERVARQKEKRQLQLQREGSDAWVSDRYYTEELKQRTPWVNPIEFLNQLQPNAREERYGTHGYGLPSHHTTQSSYTEARDMYWWVYSLTPVASDSESDGKKRKKSKRKKEKKKHKKHKKRKG